ncbi:ferredoxin--NADP(+) reductase [Acidovorax sp. SRB_14]|uniref:NAD(P)/FAD-dependent oxidoreductase n=1 Tax=Acidovorax sp. SRB_14 TaxID=1962699 RepID=UPI0015654CB3|nr:NAD(P)/FAD-dependent oxidoreductase [Acidovorax sp. SRB_14]NMM82743.1 ferredoxin--NADP(+) reductase [Acidovorax sp. SRB_14]
MSTARAPATAPLETDAVVIGAGPVGLFQVFQLGLQGLKAQVVDALPEPGGQCIELYADKPLYDIPGIAHCSGRELVERLQQQIAPFAPQWHLGESVAQLAAQADGRFLVGTSRGTQLLARAVFIAAGVGAFVPRALKVPGIDVFEGTQLLYRLDDRAAIAGRHVVVHGGDEPAVAQVLDCATAEPPPASLTLLHRRDVFDAPPAQLEQLQALRDAGRIQVAIGQITGTEQDGGRLAALQLLAPDGSTRRVPLDLLLVRLGLSPRLGPLADWGLAMERKQLVVDTASYATSVSGIHAVGDINTYPGKRRLILCGFHEATLAAFATAERLAGQKIPLEYTTSSARLQQRLGVAAADTKA